MAASPRILLLTSTLGSGHAAAGRAIEAALLEPAPSATCCTLDFWSLMESGVANAIHRAYLQLVQTCPDLYDRLYGLDQGTWNRVLIGGGALPLALTTTFDLLAAACAEALESEPEGQRYASDRVLFRLLYSSLLRRSRTSDRKGELLRQGLVQWSWARLARRLEAHLAFFRPDVIVATQMCAAALLASVKRRQGITVPAVGVLTDFGVHEFWVQPGIDSYCIAHDSIANLHRIQHARVVHTGIPLPPRFRNPPDAVQAREQLGLDVRRPVVLVQGGGLGLGVDKVAERLLLGTTGVQIVALSGRNAHARAALDPIAALLPARLQVWDWTEQIDTFLRAADVVVGKPGGVTVAEALACGRPLLATRSLRGQEGFNAAFLERHGVGWLVSEDEVVTRIQSLLAHPRELARIQRHAWALGRRAGAAQIAELVLELARSRTLPTAATAN